MNTEQPIDDQSLMTFLLECPAFENALEVSDRYITATFSDREDTRFENYFLELKETNRKYDLSGHQIHFIRPGKITSRHFLTVTPEKRKLFSWFKDLRFTLR
ncbi:hypothetical protein [Leeuwenhoekiella marinoflava]|uniref:Uncharacterized protein n=2 Tax=Leeuwenhoekiella marinoflava TaxID=988 RepID=A0A4Q0PN81_9FLAO|nr:hypothetical protein [Leeuwenhoekiella marinoflava]RXG32016.1 hypothetical protein DSL99_1319 [Leeuwenhoekiella marinoflava]SHE95091.1 hypothetical protein SAMN02745246_01376 [Leeuwenhoekiella marinoflava DSM 3653]